MSTVETWEFGYYSVRELGRSGRLRLLCGQCAEKRHTFGESVRFVDPVRETDEHFDCCDCGVEAVFGHELRL